MYELRNIGLRCVRRGLLVSLAFVSLIGTAAHAETWTATMPARPAFGTATGSDAISACNAGYSKFVPMYAAESPQTVYSYASVNYAGGATGGTCTASLTTVFAGQTDTTTVNWVQVAKDAGGACQAGPAGFHRGVVDGEKVNPFNTCHEGCVTSAVPRLDLGVSVTTGTPVKTYATWELVRKAESCDSSTSTLPTLPSTGTTATQPAPEPECPTGQRRAYLANGSPTCQPIPVDRFCPVGYTYGTVNGKDTCISQGNPGNSSGPPVVDKAPVAESGETSTTTTNPDGSTTKVTTSTDGKGGGSTTTTTTSADGKTVETVTKKMDPPKTDADKKCEPGTAGCIQLGTPTEPTVVKNEVNIGNVTPDSLSGFNIGNQCPADMTFDALGKTFAIGFKPVCDSSIYVKPLVLLLSAMAALGIVYAALTAKA